MKKISKGREKQKSIEWKLMFAINLKKAFFIYTGQGNFGNTSSQINEMNKTLYSYDIYLIDKILIAFILGCFLSTCYHVSKTYW